MKIAVVMLSGGVDSSTTLARLIKTHAVKAITFDYGQRQADFEISSSRRIARHYGVPLEVIDVSGLRHTFLGFSDTNNSVAVGFRGESPNCPHALFGLASTYTIVSGATSLAMGLHKNDFKRSGKAKEYLENYSTNISMIEGCDFSIICPYISKTKPEIFKDGNKLKVPYELTRSCCNDTEEHCGHCYQCKERKDAFVAAKMKDPTNYKQS